MELSGTINRSITLSGSMIARGLDGRGIVSIAKTGTSGLVDTYTITYTDATTSTFTVTNGANGQITATSFAEEFSSSKAYAAGDYVVYSGQLYQFTTAHAAGAWNASHATAVQIADQVSELKSAITGVRSINLANPAEFTPNTYMNEAGSTFTNADYFITGHIPVTAGKTYGYGTWNTAATGRYVTFFNGDTVVSGGLTSWSRKVTIPEGVDNIVISGKTGDIDHFMVNEEFASTPGAGAVFLPYFIPPKDDMVNHVHVFGDSWTDIVHTGWTRWPVVLGKMPGFEVVSYGLTGSNITGTATGHVNDQFSAFWTEQPQNVDTIILMGGLNDYRGGVAYTNLVTSITTFNNYSKCLYPSARFIYIANNQLYYTGDQIKFFNNIVRELNNAGIEAYTSFAWFPPTQYDDDFMHAGNIGNICIANNIANILRGGEVKRVDNKYYIEFFNDSSQRIGQFVMYETWDGSNPIQRVTGLFTSGMSSQTKTKTIDTKSAFVSAPFSIHAPYYSSNGDEVIITSPSSDNVDSSKQCKSFDLSVTNGTKNGYFSGSAFAGSYSM